MHKHQRHSHSSVNGWQLRIPPACTLPLELPLFAKCYRLLSLPSFFNPEGLGSTTTINSNHGIDSMLGTLLDPLGSGHLQPLGAEEQISLLTATFCALAIACAAHGQPLNRSGLPTTHDDAGFSPCHRLDANSTRRSSHSRGFSHLSHQDNTEVRPDHQVAFSA